jgi:2-polyprenyl-6-methoxyphenol hydroxylase-like FAD-dependent oxidoreductase
VVAIAGQLPLTAGILALVPKQLLDGPALVIPPGQSSLFMGLWKRSRESAEVLRTLGVNPSVADEEDYLVFGLAVRADRFGITGDPHSIPGTQLMQIVRRAMTRWHPDLRKLSEMINEEKLVANPLRTARHISAWQSTPVTLLGDAIHSMTPFQGIGANIALKDGALLCSQLIQAQRGEKELFTAIAEYENSMCTYAFNAVDASLRSMEFAITRKQAPGFQITKTAMRVVNQVVKLKRLRMVA